MDWNKLRTFYHVASVGSFSKAADALNITQSALSRQILDLEHGLKKTLFYRRARGLELTKHGEILFETARQMFAAIESGRSLLEEEDNQPKGLLKICTPPNIASLWISTYLSEFMEKYPEIRLAVIGAEHPNDYILSKVDIALTTVKTQSPDFIQKFLAKFHLKMYASPEYLQKFGHPESLEDLDNHRLLTYGDYIQHPYLNINWILRAGSPAGQVREPYMQINSIQGLRSMAEAGFGIITLSEENPILKSSNLIPVLPEINGPEMESYLIYPMQLKNSRRVQVFREYVEEFSKKLATSHINKNL